MFAKFRTSVGFAVFPRDVDELLSEFHEHAVYRVAEVCEDRAFLDASARNCSYYEGYGLCAGGEAQTALATFNASVNR